MLNLEKYQERIKELDYKFALCDGELKRCKDIKCNRCKFEVNERYRCADNKTKWLLEENKEPILTSKEKEYLKNVAEPRKKDITNVVKWRDCTGTENEHFRVMINMKNPHTDYEIRLLDFITTEDMPFKNLELYKQYTLEELGL